MFGTLFALVLLAMPATAVWALVRSGAVPRDDLWLRIWPTAWFPLLWLLYWVPLFFIRANPPIEFSLYIFWLPLGSWMVAGIGCRPGLARRVALGTVCLSQVVLCLMAGFSSGAWSFQRRDRYNHVALVVVRGTLKSAPPEFADRQMAPGWIEDLPPGLLCHRMPTMRALGLTEQRVHFAQWHTWLTGLYRVEPRRAGIWYPGGMPAGAAKNVEWRPR